MSQEKVLRQWEPRVQKSKIKQLNDLDAKGVYDNEFLDEVGFNLHFRFQSFISACQTTAVKVSCPVCDKKIHHDCDKQKLLICPKCGWQLTWGVYFATIQHK